MLARPRHGVDVDWNPAIAVAGLLVGVVVGLTGMGGGALMTPILVFFFGVSPLAAVSSDVVASFFMKPIGGDGEDPFLLGLPFASISYRWQ